MSEQTGGGAPARATLGVRWVRIGILICVVIVLYGLARWVDELLIAQLNLELTHARELVLHRTIMTTTAIYVVLMAVPFMPSAEIGLTMLMVFGARIAFLVYVSTVVALVIAYAIGRLIPTPVLTKACRFLGLRRAGDFLQRLAPLPGPERAALLLREAPTRIIPFLVRHRFLALAVLLNVPGNIVIGGGGGIALVAGMSRLFPFPFYLLTVALAVVPVPLIVFLTEQA